MQEFETEGEHKSGGGGWVCQDPSQLGPTMFIIKSPHQQAQRLCWCKMLLQSTEGWNQIPELQSKSTAVRSNLPRASASYTWQKPPVLTVPREQLVQVFASKIYKFTYLSLYLLPFLPLPWDQPKWYQANNSETIAPAIVTATGLR